MIIKLEFSYPMDKAPEVGEVFDKMAPMPDFLTFRGPYGAGALGVGVKGFAIYEFDSSRLKEAMDTVAKRMLNYMSVSGYTYEVTPLYDTEEIRKLIEE